MHAHREKVPAVRCLRVPWSVQSFVRRFAFGIESAQHVFSEIVTETRCYRFPGDTTFCRCNVLPNHNITNLHIVDQTLMMIRPYQLPAGQVPTPIISDSPSGAVAPSNMPGMYVLCTFKYLIRSVHMIV